MWAVLEVETDLADFGAQSGSVSRLAGDFANGKLPYFPSQRVKGSVPLDFNVAVFF